MKTSERAIPLLLEFIGAAALSVVMYVALLRSGMPFLAAIGAGLVYAVTMAVSLPNNVAQLNPVVTLGLWMARKLTTLRSIANIAAQMVGGLVAWQLSVLILERDLQNLAADKFDWQIFAAEAVGAFVFTLILSLVVLRGRLDEGKVVFVSFASLFIGMTIAALAQGGYGPINPSVALGIQSMSWSFVLGPLAGGFLGMSVVPLLDYLDSRQSKRAATKPKLVAKKKSVKKKSTKKK